MTMILMTMKMVLVNPSAFTFIKWEAKRQQGISPKMFAGTLPLLLMSTFRIAHTPYPACKS